MKGAAQPRIERRRSTTRESQLRAAQAPERLAAVLFFALPACVPILGIAGIVLLAGAQAEASAGWSAQVIYLPLAALAGAVGAWFLRPALILGSALSIALGALFAAGNFAVALMYAACAIMMGLTAKRLRRRLEA